MPVIPELFQSSETSTQIVLLCSIPSPFEFKEMVGKIRSCNFKKEEEDCLIRLVLEQKKVLEGESTDVQQQTNTLKDATWEKVTSEFNALCPALVSFVVPFELMWLFRIGLYADISLA